MKRILALLVVLVLTVPAQSVWAGGAEPEAKKDVLVWEVGWGQPHFVSFRETHFILQATPTTQVYGWVSTRYQTVGGVLYTVDATGVDRWFAGPPSAWEVAGLQLASSQYEPSFAGMVWNSNFALPGPTVRWTREGRNYRIEVKNTSSIVLYLSFRGKHERRLNPGEVWRTQTPKAGEIRLLAEKGNLYSQALWLWWK